MGAALKIHESWPNFRPLLARGLADFANDDGPVVRSSEQAERARQIEQQLDQARRWADELAGRARALIPEGGPSDIDATIELLEREEGALLRHFRPPIRKARKLIGRVSAKHSAGVRAAARTLAESIDWFEGIVLQHEQLLRDLRWALMEIRAECRRSERGDIVESAAALRQHLRSR